jgi:hypothetical protein
VTLNDDRRGGLLGMGAVHLVTSQATDPPVLRGKWVLENISDAATGAACNVPPFPENGDLTKPSRERPSCIARTRLRELSSNDGSAGLCARELRRCCKWRDLERQTDRRLRKRPDGRAFNGPAEVKADLSHPEQFVATMTSKLMTYALGRGVDTRCAGRPQIVRARRQANIAGRRLCWGLFGPAVPTAIGRRDALAHWTAPIEEVWVMIITRMHLPRRTFCAVSVQRWRPLLDGMIPLHTDCRLRPGRPLLGYIYSPNG